MTSSIGTNLGHGVRVMPGDGGGLVVQSSEIDLGWRSRVVGNAGSAVMWQGTSFEVVAREPLRMGDRWVLEPWSGDEVMRVVQPLDEASVTGLAHAAQRDARAAAVRPWMWLLAPILGFAIGPWQRRWRDELGFPAAFATGASAILEACVGAGCVIVVMAEVGGGVELFPWLPRSLAIFGMALLPVGLFRLAQVAADREPVGSFFGLVAGVFERRTSAPSAPVAGPSVHAFFEVEGVLELLSPIHRRDWDAPGLLKYRGKDYRLTGTRKLGESWIYRFARSEAADGAERFRLSLQPPRPSAVPPSEAPPGIVRVSLMTAAATLAPGRIQERWGEVLQVRPVWLTVLGAGAELVGGIVNLRGGQIAGTFWLVLNLYFVAEAIVRFGWVVLQGRPIASVLGLPLAPILERFVPNGNAERES